MEIAEISFEPQWELGNSVHYFQYYLICSWKRQKAVFADDAVEDAEEIDTILSSVSIGGRPLCNLQCADNIDLLGGSEEELPTTQ